MSNSALSSAKRRRTNLPNNNMINSPLLQSQTPTPSQRASPQNTTTETNNNRPMSLQQVLQLLNGRILQLEKSINENKPSSPANEEELIEKI